MTMQTFQKYHKAKATRVIVTFLERKRLIRIVEWTGINTKLYLVRLKFILIVRTVIAAYWKTDKKTAWKRSATRTLYN